MKILACGDLHITDKKPVNRTDDYFETLSNKLDFIFLTATKKQCEIIIFPGDIFDSHRANDFLKSFLIDKIITNGYDGNVFCVYGQHDMRYHSSDRNNTPLNVLNASGTIGILNDDPMLVNNVDFYGASFGEEIPKVITPNSFNVLVIHKMIIQDKLWKDQEEFTRANILLRNTEYDLIISGDNHQYFTAKVKDKTLINCGSLMRSNIGQVDHKPGIVVFDTKNRSMEEIQIPIKDFYDVMNMQTAIQSKERDQEMEAFIATLSGDNEISGLDFTNNLARYVKENKVPKAVKSIIEEIME